jgi:hypothetical protein
LIHATSRLSLITFSGGKDRLHSVIAIKQRFHYGE